MGKSGVLDRLRSRVISVVAAIPEGRVTTYGIIAKRLKCTARQVAFVLTRFTPEESARLPWFRVVAAKGVISSIKRGSVGRRQIEFLRAEGVVITPRNTIAEFDAIVWTR